MYPGSTRLGRARYTRTAVALHWTLVVVILCALAMGWVMTHMAITPLKVRLYSWHKWIGVTALALLGVRALWRLHRPPPPMVPMPAWQHVCAQMLHAFLYVMMLMQPLTGWVFSNASGYPIVYLARIRLPNLVGPDKALANAFRNFHHVGAAIFAAAIAVHALAALKHHWKDQDDTLRRMLRWRVSPVADMRSER